MGIRFGTLDDLPILAEINSLGSEEGRKIAEERLPAFVDARNLIVSKENGEIVGLLYWKEKFLGTDNWELTQVTVDEKHRRKGVAEALIKYFLGLAKGKGVKEIWADTNSANIPSINLLGKLRTIKVRVEGDKIFWKFDL